MRAGRQTAVTDTLGHVTHNVYNDNGQLIKTIVNYDPARAQNDLNQYNLTTDYGYDTAGHQILVTDTVGHATLTEYDALNRPVTVTTNYSLTGPIDAATNLTRTTGYDSNGNAVTQTDTLGRMTVTGYDEVNRPVTVTTNYVNGVYDPTHPDEDLSTITVYTATGQTVAQRDAAGHWSYSAYDELGRLITSTNALSGTSVTVYNAVGQRSKVQDANGNWTTFEYDRYGRLITTTDALSATTVTIYDALGRRAPTINALGQHAVYTYSLTGRLVATADASGAETLYQYDALGRTIIVTDTLGHATRTQYDDLGRVVTVTNALTGTTITEYDALGRRSRMQDARGNWTTVGYDELGRVITTTDATGRASVAVYDRAGNTVETRSCYVGVCQTQAYFEYDRLGRLIAQSDALYNTTRYGYDAAGQRVRLIDANGVETRYDYDAMSRLISVTENYLANGPSDYQTNLVTQYQYDALGNRTVMTNARGYTTTYTYDALSRPIEMQDARGKITAYGYDALSNRTVLTDANNQVTLYAYDALNRPTLITYTADGQTVQYAYDAIGNRLAMTDSLGTTSYTYDSLNRVTQVTDPFTGTVQYQYDSNGNRSNLIYPDGKVVTYTYDAAGLMTSVVDWAAQTTTYTYDTVGRLITTTLPNGLQTAYTYDAANRLTRLTHTRSSDGEIVGDYQFVLDKVGNRLAVTETLLTPDTGSGQSAALLPTQAEEVAAAVTGHRPPGLSALAILSETLPISSTLVPPDPIFTPTLEPTPTPMALFGATPTPVPGPEAIAQSRRPVLLLKPADLAGETLTGETLTGETLTHTAAVTDTGWLATAQATIRQSEYHITWQDRTDLPDLSGAYQAPNRANNLRTYFTATGIRTTPRTPRKAGQAGSWDWGLSLTGYGDAGNIRPANAADLSTTDNRIDYRRGALTEWYLNDERGLEQGFTLAAPPESALTGSSTLVFELSLAGNLTPGLAEDGTAIDFTTPEGIRVLRYSDLRAHDASGRALPVRLELAAARIRLVVDDHAALYPITVDPLVTSPSWTAESDQTSAQLGYSLGTAGDVNGDGYADVIVGAYLYDNGQTDEGRAFVYYGSASGLNTAANWTAEGDQASAHFGKSVGAAGDVNGDGYADVIVGAPDYDNGQTDEGQVFVYYGSASGLSTTVDRTVDSNQASAGFGGAVSTAGDVNGDGYADMIVGAPLYDNGQTDEGRAFVYYGSATGISTTASWTAESDQASANFGSAVSAAGDVNGDGYADVVVGAYLYDNGQTDEGRAFIYYGSSTGLSATANRTLESDQASADFALSVGTAGDVNGDGYADVIVGAYLYDNGERNEGRAFAYYGSATGISTTANWTTESNQRDAYLGYSVGTAGDVNGDGYADVIVGAYLYDNGQTDEGRAFVYYGSSTGLSTTASWTAEGDQASAHFGKVVGAAGDVNGDGYSDVIVGSPDYDNGQTDEGRAFVYQGSASSLSPAANWTAESDQAYASFGYTVNTAGDVNGDGYADVIVGAYLYDNGQTDEGKAFVYYGSATGLSTTANWTAESDQAGAGFGLAVGTAGDVNGDGYADVSVGAYFYDNGQTDEGKAFVYYGSATGLSTTANWTAEGDQEGAGFGGFVSTAGDVNGDGYADVIVGALKYDNGQTDEGRAYLYSGSAAGLNTTASWTAESDQEGARFGFAGTAGDVNGDGYADVIVGAPLYDNGQTDEGRAFVYYGSPAGLSTTASWTAESDQASAAFGESVGTAGDVNGDGYADVIVGAPYYSNNQTEGGAFVYYGSASGLSLTPNWTAESNQGYAQFGVSVGTAGDVNGDGYADVIIGAWTYNNGQGNAGRAYVYHGSASGLSTTINWTAESDQGGAYLGGAVGTAGDVNGDGYADVIVGADSYSNGQANEGRAFVYYGNASAGLSLRPRQMRTDGSVQIAPLGRSDSTNTVQLHLTGRTPLGREKVKLQWQVAPLGTPFTATNTISGTSAAWTDVLTTGVVMTQNVSGLAANTAYHWRARLLYRPGNPLGESASRWIHVPWNGWNEQDFRTLGTPVTADFSASPLTGTTPLTVTFTNTSSGATSYQWTFGDGTTSTAISPTHVYTPSGVYTVSLTATGPGGSNTLTRTNYLTVTSSAPITTVVAIAYTYDPLSRLTDATYSNGQQFQYAYDPVGNRTVQTQTITSTQVTNYIYDAANRLSSVNGQAYTWDDNGNLVNDGNTAYAYDQANRLISATLGMTTTQFAYNGDGARLKQIVNGSPTTYMLDLAAPLVQVLMMQDAGSKTAYEYGLTRIGEQQVGGWVYHLSDALGSVRQLADANAQVVLARGYTPYGEPLWMNGAASSRYAFTGEDYDPSLGLGFLRARYMLPALGIFLTRDKASSNERWPSSNWAFAYANANPVNHIDPSGLCVFCDSGDSIKVDGRPDGELVVHARPDANTPEVARINDYGHVRIVDSRPTDWTHDGWRKVSVTSRMDDGGFDEVTGWVKNVKLLDNCDGPSGTFACWPVTGDIAPTYGFGPNQWALDHCGHPAGKQAYGPDCEYSDLRGLHNGLDFGVDPGNSLVWMGTSDGTVVNMWPRDAADNIEIELQGQNVEAVFGHTRRQYPEANVGRTVRPGQTIGESGGTHLHLGVRNGRVFYNPLYYFTAALQVQIVVPMQGYPEPYGPYSMVSFDADAVPDDENFWKDCSDLTGIVFLSGIAGSE